MKARLASLVASILAPSLLQASRLPIRTYTTADGLARDHVLRIVQDSMVCLARMGLIGARDVLRLSRDAPRRTSDRVRKLET